jgi:hypothetical protein
LTKNEGRSPFTSKGKGNGRAAIDCGLALQKSEVGQREMETSAGDGRPFMVLVATTVSDGVKEVTISGVGACMHVLAHVPGRIKESGH